MPDPLRDARMHPTAVPTVPSHFRLPAAEAGGTAGGEACWRLAPLVRLCWRCVDEAADGWLVYDAGSGQTHALEPLAAAVLGLIEEQALSPGHLEATLAQQLSDPDAAPDEAALDAVQQLALQHTLGHLQAAGLLELG